MRNDSPVFAIENRSQSKAPHYVVEIAFDASASSLWYLTTHETTGDLTKNLLLQTENFAASAWIASGVTVSAETTCTVSGTDFLGNHVIPVSAVNYIHQDVSARQTLYNKSYSFGVGALTSSKVPVAVTLQLSNPGETEAYTKNIFFVENAALSSALTTTFTSTSATEIRAKIFHVASAENQLKWSNNFSTVWAKAGGAIVSSSAAYAFTTEKDAWRIQSSTTGDNVNQILTTLASGRIPLAAGIFLLKKSNSEPAVAIEVYKAGGVTNTFAVVIDAYTGEFAKHGALYDQTSVIVDDINTYWRIGFTFKDDEAANVIYVYKFYPAYHSSLHAESSTATPDAVKGSATVLNAFVAHASSIMNYASTSSVASSRYDPGLYLTTAQLNEGGQQTYYPVSSKQELIPSETYEGVISQRNGISGTTQQLDTLKSTSTIGAISVNAIDENGDLTTLINGQLSLGYGLRGKRLRVYAGFDGYAFSNYQLIQTQIIDSIDYNDGVYKFNCVDVQRIQRKDVFTLAKTTLSSSVTASSTQIEVFNATGFQMFAHSTSFTDAPVSTVGYVQIDDEIISYNSVVESGSEWHFTGCLRGRLNTKTEAHEYDPTVGTDRQKEVEEFVYLEMPAPKMSYALLTGNLIGQPLPVFNYAQHSNQFENWILDAVTVSTNEWSSPVDGTITGDVIREDSSNGNHRMWTSAITSTIDGKHAYSMYVRPRGRNIFRILSWIDSNNLAGFQYNMSGAGSITWTTFASASGSARISAVDDSTYHIEGTFALNNTDAKIETYLYCIASSGSAIYEGNGSSGIDIANIMHAQTYEWVPSAAYASTNTTIQSTPHPDLSETLPDEWHMAVASTYVKQSDFTGIGDDLWDSALGDSDGLITRFAGIGQIDGKRFIEEQLYRLMGCYSPVYADGTVGLRRMTSIMSDAPTIATLDHSNITRLSGIKHDMRSTRNKYIIDWNYDFIDEKYTRRNAIIDSDSIGRHGDVPAYAMKFDGLHGSRHTFNTTAWLFDALRDRYAAPPITMSVEALPSMNHIEVGDIIHVQTSAVRDYSEGGTLDRAFEVQNVNTDWVNGRVRFQLQGASEKAVPFQATAGQVFALTTAFYSGTGSDLTATYGSSYFSTIGDVLHLTSSLSITGASTMTAATFYTMQDLTIDSGITLSISLNVRLQVMGFFTVNGDIDGAGTGTPADTAGGVFGYTKGHGGVNVGGGPFYITYTNYYCTDIPVGDGLPSVPVYALDFNGSFTITGSPEDMRGKAGYAGGDITLLNMFVFSYPYDIYDDDGNPVQPEATYALPAGMVQAGGAGGAGGAGLIIVSRGMGFGVSGYIDLSGENGADGARWDAPNYPTFPDFWSGSGAGGGTGGVLIILDGTDATRPDITVNTITGRRGHSSFQASAILPYPSSWLTDNKVHIENSEYVGTYFNNAWGSYYTGYASAGNSQSMARVVYIEPEATAEADPNELTLSTPFNVTASSGTDHLFINSDGTVVSRIYSTWDVSSIKDIAGYELQYAFASTVQQWFDVPPVVGQTVSAAYLGPVQDGVAYDVRVRAASNDRRTGDWGYSTDHTVIGKTEAPSDPIGYVAAFSDGNIVHTWDKPSDADYSHTEIRYGGTDWGSATLVIKFDGTSYTHKADFIGNRTYRIKHFDSSGNESDTAATTIVNVASITIGTLSSKIVDSSVLRLTWGGITAILPVDYYEIRHGITFATATVLDRVVDQIYDVVNCTACLQTGTQTFWVVGIDTAGNYGAGKSANVLITAPGVPNITYDVIDNFVLLKFASVAGTFTIGEYRVYKDSVSDANEIGSISGQFTTIFETQSGIYQYHIRARDVNGNFGASNSVDVNVDQPPDYVLNAVFTSVWSGTRRGCQPNVHGGGELVIPIDMSTTIASAVSAMAEDTPASAILAGYNHWIQPTPTSAMYSEIFDYEANITGSQVTASRVFTVIDGVVSGWERIWSRATTTDSWATVVTSTTTGRILDQFRYIKYDFHAKAAGGNDVATLSDLQIRLDSKLKTDQGVFTITVPTSGALITLNGSANSFAFADVQSIQLTAGGSALNAVYDFVDVVNPSSFIAYVYDKNGVITSGSGSWTARGF